MNTARTDTAIAFVILGEPASKANSRRLATIKKRGKKPRPAFIKSDKALGYLELFRAQCPRLRTLLTGDLCVTIRIYYASRRPDLDESVILDAMQGRVFGNDRQVRERHVYWGLDKANPRAEIEVSIRGEAPMSIRGGVEP